MPIKINILRRLSLIFFLCLGNFAALPLLADQAKLVLTNGWNLVSLPLAPTNALIDEVLAPIQGEYESVWSYINGRWYGLNPSVPGLHDLVHMYAGQAYWIKMSHDAVLTVNGLPALNGPNTYAGKKLTPGWNLLGYSSGLSQDVTLAFAPMAGHLDLAAAYSNGSWLWYAPGKPALNALGSLSPFRGVWVHVDTNTVWIAPNFRGAVVDATTGKPVIGATASLDGIEAEAPTDPQGAFLVTGIPDAASQLLTVIAPGYVPLVTTNNLNGSSQPVALILTPLPSPFKSEVLVPQNNSVWVQP